MTKKQKKMRLRIIISLVLFVILFVCEHMGVLEPLPWWAQLLIFAVPYLIVGYDIIFKAARNISHGQIFDENFLMMIATFGAFGVGRTDLLVAYFRNRYPLVHIRACPLGQCL